MDDNVKAILSDLARAISDGLERSRKVEASVRRLEEMGFQFSLYLEATLLLTRADERPARTRKTTQRVRSGSLRLNQKDLRYLKSLKIALHEPDRK